MNSLDFAMNEFYACGVVTTTCIVFQVWKLSIGMFSYVRAYWCTQVTLRAFVCVY